MSDASTRRLIDVYTDEAPASMFLTSTFFTNVRRHNSEEVEIDVQRDDEQVAVVIQDLSVGTRKNESGKYTNKSFKPPLYNEEGTVTSFDLMKREPGQSPFEDPQFNANAVRKAFGITRKLHNKVLRAIELQSAQVLTTGELILIDDAGVALYSLDFQPKSSHFVTTTPWAADGTTGNPLADIESLASVLRRDGRRNPGRLVFGTVAWTRFMANAQVKAYLNSIGHQVLLKLEAPQLNSEGATFMGYITAGTYRFECWVYDAVYQHPQTGVITPYVPTDRVIMAAPGARMDITFGGIPRIVPPDPRIAAFLPSRLEGPDFDLSLYAWITQDGTHLKLSVGSRPLVIPVAIDTFGCLDVV